MADKKYGITLDSKEYTVAITDNGSNSYSVEIEDEEYNVTVRDIALDNISNHVTGIEESSYVYTGSAIEPDLVTDGTVTEDVDYTVEYQNNTAIGTGKVIVKAIGSTYTGSVEFTFAITDAIANHVTGLAQTEYTYTGSEIKPGLVTDGTIAETKDFTLKYENNTNVGTGVVTVTGAGNYTGSVVYNFTISKADITAHITGLEQSTYTHTGEEIKPTVVTDGTVTLNTDYTVTYADNIEVGEGSATVDGINNYQGNTVYKFTIEAES